MATMAGQAQPGGVGASLADMVDASGTGAHRFVQQLIAAPASANLADAVHFLCLLHGRYPGVMDHAADRVFDPAARDWMFRAAAGFAAERAFLTRLVVAAGPTPSTLGQAQSETAVQGQTHALAVLSQSDRRGTALGAAFALVLDWRMVRAVMDAAASRFGLAPPPQDLPGRDATVAITTRISTGPAIARATTFGGQQMLVQHRGLWDLLETRSSARRDG